MLTSLRRSGLNNPPTEVKVAAPIIVEEKTITYNDPVVPTAYIEKPPFPIRIKDHAKASTVVRKSNIRTYTPPEQVKVEPNVAIVKDLLADNIDGHVIYFCNEAARIARPDTKNKHRHVVGMPVISVKNRRSLIWVLVKVQYLIPYTKKLCMILHLLR